MIGLGTICDRGHLLTQLRMQFALTSPQIVLSPAPTLADMTPEQLELWKRYARLYKEFIRPVLPTCKVYHHAPITATGGHDDGSWSAMEFAAPDRTRGWALVVRQKAEGEESYRLRLRSLDPSRKYLVTFDNSGGKAVIEGSRWPAKA